MTSPVASAKPKLTRVERIMESYAVQYDRYARFADAIRVLLRQLCNASGVVAEISARPKGHDSLRKKLELKNHYEQLRDIPDLAGARIVVSYTSHVQLVAEMLSEQFEIVEDVPHGGEQPEAFGYASHHMIVKLSSERAILREWDGLANFQCEVQVRTILQHAWASISHSLDYKSANEIPNDIKRKLFQVAALIEVGDGLFESFRKDVESTRKDYRNTAEGGDWRMLPVDSESLRAAWGRLPLGPIAKILTDVGATVINIDEATSDQIAEFALTREEAQRFVAATIDISQRCGISTIGGIADAVASSDVAESWKQDAARVRADLAQVQVDTVFTEDYILGRSIAKFARLHGHSLDGLAIPSHVMAGLMDRMDP